MPQSKVKGGFWRPSVTEPLGPASLLMVLGKISPGKIIGFCNLSPPLSRAWKKTRREQPRRFTTEGRIVFLPPADPPVCFLTLVPAGGRVLHNHRAWKMSANTENGRKKLHPTVFHGSAHLCCEFWIPGRSSCSRWLLWPQRWST